VINICLHDGVKGAAASLCIRSDLLERRYERTTQMYEAYFTRRLLEALSLAEHAEDAEERSIHLRTSRYYRDLLEYPEKRHAVRYRARIGAMLYGLGVRARRVTVSDLSCRGFRIQLDEQVKPGHLVTLEMDGLSALNAFIVWQDEEQIGCKFVSELHPALVEAALAVSTRN
jgi:hypothetical protein